MKKKSVVVFVILSLVITSGFIAGLFVIAKSRKKQQEVRDYRMQVEDALYKYYTGKKQDPKELERVNALQNSTNMLLRLSALFFNSLIKKDVHAFRDYYEKLPEQLQKTSDVRIENDIVKFLFGQKITETNNFTGSNVYYLANLYQLYRLLNRTNAGFVRSHPNAYLFFRKMGIYFHNNNYLDFAREWLAILMRTGSFEDPALQSYYGSTLTKYALFVSSPLDKVSFVSKGTKYIDRAVYDHPDFLVPRLVRILNYLSLPSFFKKYGFIIEDMDFLIDRYQKKQKVKVIKGYNRIEKIFVPRKQLIKALEKIRKNNNFPKDAKKKYMTLLNELNKMK